MKISKADCPEMIKDTTPVQDGFSCRVSLSSIRDVS